MRLKEVIERLKTGSLTLDKVPTEFPSNQEVVLRIDPASGIMGSAMQAEKKPPVIRSKFGTEILKTQ